MINFWYNTPPKPETARSGGVTNMNKVYEDITAERQRQIDRGCDQLDQEKSRLDWVCAITYYASRSPLGMRTFRESMVKVAALAVAAIEWEDGKNEA